ncbi:hypothetical protein NC653_005917 [Populus alba x Populus x berolinensis]|uniref:Uncharacterized protein n=1 Tax=Populus alba x Populus x berolinensis TaxID=444605 RepID=A0AAD6RD58_9ROSI|nr:hypothetical protein NC653_005917 [Populus alba x Populus x berolinensis]
MVDQGESNEMRLIHGTGNTERKKLLKDGVEEKFLKFLSHLQLGMNNWPLGEDESKKLAPATPIQSGWYCYDYVLFDGTTCNPECVKHLFYSNLRRYSGELFFIGAGRSERCLFGRVMRLHFTCTAPIFPETNRRGFH